MTTNVADDEAARLAALIGDSDSADSTAEGAEPSPRDAGRAPTPEPEADGEERAPSSFLFGELCRVRERAAKSEVEAQALERKLSMAEDLRGVDVARARAASSRALAEALAALRRRAARDGGDADADADAAAERDEAQTWDRRAEGWAYERNQRLARLEAACDDARRAWRGEPYRNGDGVARRVVAAVEACLAHRAAAGYAAFLLEVRHAASMRRLHRRGDGVVASRPTPSPGEDASKKRRPAPRRPSPRRAPGTGRPRAARARPRCGPSRAPRTRASGAGSAASAGIAPASCRFRGVVPGRSSGRACGRA